MRLVVGLGNPGPGYAKHRHNVGFMAVDEIVRRHGLTPPRVRFEGTVSEGAVAGHRIIALKPMTYMNESGRSVAAAARFYKIEPGDVIVIHDEVDLAPGRMRVKLGGGSAGHNGLRSIDAHLGADYKRVRVGVGHPGRAELVPGYVLHDFAKSDRAWLDPLLDALAESIGLLVAGDDAGFMNKVALAVNPPRPKRPPPTPAPER